MQRRLNLECAYNVRDVGGYPTANGRAVRWRTLLRADALHRLSQADQETLLSYGIRTIVDLRHDTEVESAPNVFAHGSAVSYHHIPLFRPTSTETDTRTSYDLSEIYVRALDEAQPAMREILTAIGEGFPALVHCTAGKDRTGVVIALLLSLAGVPDDVIIEDYAISNALLQPLMSEFRLRAMERGIDSANYEKLLHSKPETMHHMLSHLHAQYGGADSYLRMIGLSNAHVERLRDTLLD